MKKKPIVLALLGSFLGLYAQKQKDTLKEKEIKEVVVTALGIKRQARSLTYSAQQISNEDLTAVKTPNLLNAVAGKVSNVQINKTNGGVGGSVRIVMRGDKSTRNSQPLFVIDGIPVQNTSGGSPNVDFYAGMPDSGDVLSTINPDDIQSINFLKGASASALYGAQGSNGVVLITTKKGASGKSQLSYSTTLTFDKVYDLPKLQHSYLQTNPYNKANGLTGSQESWGTKGASKDDVKDFFNTGTTWTNSLSFQSGNEVSTNYFSVGNTTNKGIIPTSSFDQYNIGVRNSSKFLDSKLTLDANVLASIQDIKNRITPGSYFSPLTNLYWLPRGINFNDFSGNNYSYFNYDRYLPAQNWWAIKPDGSFAVESQNPYWILNKNPVYTKNKNFYGAVGLTYTVNNWLTAKVRANYSYYNTNTERDVYVYSLPVVLGGTNNGAFNQNTLEKRSSYADAILLASPKLVEDITFDFTLGGSISDIQSKITAIQNNKLFNANVFSLSNLQWPDKGPSGGYGYTIFTPKRQDQSVFASANVGYKNYLYLDLTFRNDWSSTLSGTGYNSFDYESFGLGAILNNIFKLPESINYWKVRASYATVGNALEPTVAMPQQILNAGAISQNYNYNPVTNPLFKDLFPKPELNKTFEIGTELRAINDKLSFDFTFYKSNSTNQLLTGVSAVSDFGASTGTVDINAGNIQNTGFEAALSYDIIKRKNLGWSASINASSNKNIIVELLPEKYYTADTIFGLSGSGYNKLKKGGSYGDLYGYMFKRDDQGRIIVDADGVPLKSNNIGYLGNPNPKFMIGLNNNFNFKKINLSFLIDGKFGGKALEMTQSMNDKYGVSQATADARDAGGVTINNAVYANGTAYTGKTDAAKYYSAVSGRDGIEEAYIYSATAVRLRQVSASYTFEMNKKYMKNITLSVIGSNLFFIYKKAPFDPEQVSGVNPGGVGVDMFGMPITRSIGLSLKANF